MDLPIKDYFAHAYRMSDSEIKIRDSLMDWLPDEIVDAHAHCNLAAHVVDINPKARQHMLSTFPYFPLEDSERLRTMFFPGKRLRSLRFAKTYRGLDHRAANDYLLEHSPKEDRVALFGLPEDVEYTNQMLRHPRVSALKMYWSYVEPSAEVIYDFFRPEILEEAQANDIPLVLHLPKVIVRSLDDLLQVTRDFPRLRMVLAHLGLSKLVVPGLEEALKEAAKVETIFMDTALNPSADVVAMSLRIFGAERIMFGSDEPLNLIRSVAYEHPEKGQRIVSDYPYHWVDKQEFNEYGHLAKGARHSHWLSMLAIKEAMDRLPAKEQTAAKEWLFRKTAEAVYGF
jgi:predicted TIM-barrel fold metal-dependent hydrolase